MSLVILSPMSVPKAYQEDSFKLDQLGMRMRSSSSSLLAMHNREREIVAREASTAIHTSGSRG